MDDPLTRSLDLLREAQAGDESAQGRLFERYYERVRSVVRLRLGSRLRGRMDSGDILQETFLQAVRSFENFEAREEASLINWLCKLAERQILAAADYHGAQRREADRAVSMTPPPSASPSRYLAGQLADETRGPIDRLSDEEREALVEECVGELPPDLRELILMRDYLGASWETVAQECQRPSPDAARMMHARALAELGVLLRARGL